MPWLAVPFGVVTGMVMGGLGGGGAILTIPVLVFVLGQSPHTATTESLVIVGLSSLTGMIGHLRAGRVRVGDALVLAAVGTLGTYAGSWLSAFVPGSVLLALLAALLVVVAGLMLRQATPAAGHVDPPPLVRSPPLFAKVAALGTGIGALTGFFGVGGGFAIVPGLTLVLGYSMPTAIGTSLLVIALNSATAFLARLGHGIEVDWALVAVFTVSSAAGSLIGGRLSRRTSPAVLSKGFAILLFGVAAYTLVNAVLAR